MASSSMFDRVRFTTNSAPGTGAVAGTHSAVAAYRTPAGASIPNGTMCTWLGVEGTAWEVWSGAYTTAGTSIARTTFRASSTGGAISFTTAAIFSLVSSAFDLQEMATTTITGIVELATDAEAIARSATNRVLTPSNLAAVDSDYQAFTSSGTGQTWTDPGFGTMVRIQMWGGGGSGGVRASIGAAGGGGGGVYIEFTIPKSEIVGNKLVDVAAGGASVASSNANGNPGGTSAFDTAGLNLRAYGGGGGFNVATTNLCNGGRGGTWWGVGGVGSGSNDLAIGGFFGNQPATALLPTTSASGFNDGVYSASGGIVTAGGAVFPGGSSIFGGAAGGPTTSAGNVNANGGTSVRGGAGGDGESTSAGGNGTAPGGGGGAARNTFASGAGAVGKVEVWVW